MRKTNMNDFYRPTRRWWAALLFVLGVQVSMPTLAQEYQEIPDPTSDGPYNPGGAPAASSSQGYPIPEQTREASRQTADEAVRQYQEEQRQNMEALIHGIGEVMRKKKAEKEKKEKEEEKDDREYIITPDGKRVLKYIDWNPQKRHRYDGNDGHGDDDHGDNGYTTIPTRFPESSGFP